MSNIKIRPDDRLKIIDEFRNDSTIAAYNRTIDNLKSVAIGPVATVSKDGGVISMSYSDPLLADMVRDRDKYIKDTYGIDAPWVIDL